MFGFARAGVLIHCRPAIEWRKRQRWAKGCAGSHGPARSVVRVSRRRYLQGIARNAGSRKEFRNIVRFFPDSSFLQARASELVQRIPNEHGMPPATRHRTTGVIVVPGKSNDSFHNDDNERKKGDSHENQVEDV
ncbi:MAG TPA: hypothetical protein VN720_02140 [Rudaea sp.]|nr:hypothetical protein [Rudaea sp.]